MAKVQDYELRRLGQQAVDFHDDLRDVLNNGKVAHSIVSAVPAWKADNGEMAFYDGAAGGGLPGKRIYVRLSSSWSVFAVSPFSGVPGGQESSIQSNSSSAFYGDNSFFWIKATSSLVVQDVVNAETSLVVGTRGNVSILAGSHGATAQGVMAFGVGVLPPNTVDTVQILGRAMPGEPSSPTGLAVVPEGGDGLYLFGNRVFTSSGADITIHGRQFAANLNLQGALTTATPSQVTFGDVNGARATIGHDVNTVYHGLPARDVLNIGPNLVNSAGYIRFNASNYTPGFLTSEAPMVVFAPQTVGFNSGLVLSTQRHHIIFRPLYTAASATTITNAATLFIEGAPRSLNSLSITNSYALWISGGSVRFDGEVINNGATTSTKTNGVFFTSTAVVVNSNNTTETTMVNGIVGTTSVAANTFSEGRTIRLTARGYYNTTTTAGTAIMTVYLGNTALLATSNQTITSSISSGGWVMESLITCQTTGGAGTLFCQGRFDPQSSAVATQAWQMVGSSTVVMNTTQANILEIRYQWGTANAGLQFAMTNAVGELLN